MGELPDELWMKILEMGVSPPSTSNRLTFKDLCSLSISSHRLNRISTHPSLWSSLLSLDFPTLTLTLTTPTATSTPKSLYQSRFEKDKAKRIAAHRRAVLRIESRVSEHSSSLRDILSRRSLEAEKLKDVATELSGLRRVRQASVALNVWQPEVVRGRQKQIVEQCAVPVDSRIHTLEMELKLCRQQIIAYEKAYRDEKQRLEAAKEQLESMKYHPLHDCSATYGRVDDHSTKRKKSKMCSPAEGEQSEKS